MIPTRAIFLRVATGILSAGVMASAPAPAFAAPQFHDQPASARSLPADRLPPFGMLDDEGKLVPTPQISASELNRGPGTAAESSAAGPGLVRSLELARLAIDACGAAGYRVGVAVIDSAGEARAMLTADGSDGSHVFVAMRKALTALHFEMPSSAAKEAVNRDKSLLGRVTPNMFVEGGALPIVQEGKLIGAIGVSGAAGSPIGRQDEVCAARGLQNQK